MQIMRFIHSQVGAIRRFIDSGGFHVFMCRNDSTEEPIKADSTLLDQMLRESRTLWGLALPHYAKVSRSIDFKPISLHDDVSAIEASSATDVFLIVAYQDGGVISVSGSLLAFQEDAEPADWWSPKY